MPPLLPRLLAIAVTAVSLTVSASAAAQTARERYGALTEREDAIRIELDSDAGPAAIPRDLARTAAQVMTGYEVLVRRFPTSGYADNALWRAGALAEALYEKARTSEYRDRALKYYTWLIREYPASSLVRRASARVPVLTSARTAMGPAKPASQVIARAASSSPPADSEPPATAPASSVDADRATLVAVQRVSMPDAVRVTLELDREVAYREERLTGPSRVFFDLKSVQLATALVDKVLTYPTDVVRLIRVGRHPNNTVRIVLDLEDVTRYSVFTLYSPFRVVIDCERKTGRAFIPVIEAPITTVIPTPLPIVVTSDLVEPVPPPQPAATPPAPPPIEATVPLANAAGGFSMARQLGLGISRVVIDPGHGGQDPGAQGAGLDEADLVLDVALRLERLLKKEAGLDVVLTRRTDSYVPLTERTAIANRQSADLFISIHANASRNAAARGIETYFLSFASSPDAEAVAARENAASDREMHHLPDMIKAIALNNKLDESRDLAGIVQESLTTHLRKNNREVRSLGVKKAPFVVLIGAAMPSVLAEISFVTNKQDLQLLKTAAYKERIAESLQAAIVRYRRGLKAQSAIASQ